MHEHILVGLALIVALGVGAQWLAWRLRLPSILLLLAVGFIAGPLARSLEFAFALDPDALFGDLLLPLVSLSVAVILYEGGLTLSLRDLPKVGGAVWRLVTIGMLITWLLAAGAADVLLGLSWPMSLLLGAVLVVSGPTVIIPMLRHIRPIGAIGPIIKWEGIVIDPIGATLAVLVFEVAFAALPGHGMSTALWGIVRTVFVGGGCGAVAGLLLAVLVRKHGIPDYLHNAVSLMLVTAVFTISNAAQHESGLFAVTVMGIVLANQRLANVHHIIDFKENLRVLLISLLFVLLAARLRVADVQSLGVASLLFVGALIVVIRPVAAVCSTFGTKLNWAERGLLAWMAPRGIVAAAVSSVFALRLEEAFPEARVLVPVTFLAIVATVTIYGLTATPLARWLGLADSSPQGCLIVGGHTWARALAEVLKREGVDVLVVDRNRDNVRQARLANVAAYEGNILGEYVLDELDLRGIGRMLAMTPNDEVNALAVQRFERVFGRAEVYQLPPSTGRRGQKNVPREMHGRLLFTRDVTYAALNERYFGRGAVFRATNITQSFNLTTLLEQFGDSLVPMFIVRKGGSVVILTPQSDAKPRPGDTLIALGPKDKDTPVGQAKKRAAEQQRAREADAAVEKGEVDTQHS